MRADAGRKAAARCERRRSDWWSSCHASIEHEFGSRHTHRSQLVIGRERDKLDGNIRKSVPIPFEAVSQPIEIRQNVGIEICLDRMPKFNLTGAIMRERKQADHG